MVGIRQLAQHLDISIGTVSRALNGRPDVNEDTRKRVLDAAAALGYTPNQAGRSLRKGSTGVIGFMMQTGADVSGDGDSFFLNVFDGVQSVLTNHHLDLVALLCPSNEDPDAYLQRMVTRGFADGIILSATRRIDTRIVYLSQRNIPFVALGRSQTEAGQSWIDLDFEGMAETGIRRLHAQGHTRIGIFVPATDINLGSVFEARYRQVLTQLGIEPRHEYIFRTAANETGGYRIAQQIGRMDDRPTAFVLINEVMAVGLYRGLIEQGIMPGRDIAIIGRESPHARYLTPKLTCFRLSLFDLGVQIARSLLARMPEHARHYPGGRTQMIWPMDLVQGESDQGTPESIMRE